MRFFLLATLPTTLLSFTTVAAPTHAAHSTNAVVYIHLLSTQNTHYTPGSSQQSSSSSSSGGSTTIPVQVGQAFDLSIDPPFAQVLEISRIAPGSDLQGAEVDEDDGRVVCQVAVDFGSEGPEVVVGEKKVIEGGKGGSVTGLSCELREEN